MSAELTTLLYNLAGSSPLAVAMMVAIWYLWKDNQSKDRCKNPDKEPCGICRVCIERRHDIMLEKIVAEHSKGYTKIAKAVEEQERLHREEITQERERNDALHVENRATLREVLASFQETE